MIDREFKNNLNKDVLVVLLIAIKIELNFFF